MAIGDVLKSMRSSQYAKPEEDDEKEEASSSRSLLLSDEECQSIGPYTPGQEATLEVTGRLEEDNHFHVMSVKGKSTMPDQDMKGMAAQVAGMPERAMPSPS